MLVCANTFESLNIEALWIKWLQSINKFNICVKPLKAESLILIVLFEIHFVVSRQNDKTRVVVQINMNIIVIRVLMFPINLGEISSWAPYRRESDTAAELIDHRCTESVSALLFRTFYLNFC